MRLGSFQVKNYKSISDTGVVKLSDLDNITVLAGQNESGKSSILRALRDFEHDEFDNDSLPFSIDTTPVQSVSCTYEVEDGDDLPALLLETLKEELKIEIPDGESAFSGDQLTKVKTFTITKTKEGKNFQTEIDSNTFKTFLSALKKQPSVPKEPATPPQEASAEPATTEPTTPAPAAEPAATSIPITEDDNSKVATIFWKSTPNIVFFDDFCDLLPDSILISDLKEEKADKAGYTAVRNLEKILKTDFVDKDAEKDSVRGVKSTKENEALSIDFQKDWGQRIHGENKVIVRYEYQKRNGEAADGSYINFYVETKPDEALPPKQRSKGLVWFLSLWLEIKAQDITNDGLILLLDEPDQHLHVRAQKDILKLINKLASKSSESKGDQIIYATHSPYLIETEHLNRIKLIVNSEKGGTTVEDIVTSKIDTEYKRDALKPVADAIGLSVSEFSTLNKENVLLEGISDFYYFSAMKKVLNLSGDYHFVPGIGVRQINNLISLCIGYGLEWLAVIDDDPEEGGKDSKKKFDEVRDHVFDGDDEKTKEKVYILPDVVGIENMFTHDDLKLIDPKIGTAKDKVKAVGKKRKVLFSKLFFEKVENGDITADHLSQDSKDKFTAAFNFIAKLN